MDPTRWSPRSRSCPTGSGSRTPLSVRYARWLGTLAGVVPERLGDPRAGPRPLGPAGGTATSAISAFSLMQREPVIEVVGERIGHTARLAAWSVGIAVPLALTLGALAGARPGSAVDRTISTVTVALTSLPEFVVAVLLLALFSAWLGWLPGDGDARPGRPLAGGGADGAARGRARDRVGGLPHPHHPAPRWPT